MQTLREAAFTFFIILDDHLDITFIFCFIQSVSYTKTMNDIYGEQYLMKEVVHPSDDGDPDPEFKMKTSVHHCPIHFSVLPARISVDRRKRKFLWLFLSFILYNLIHEIRKEWAFSMIVKGIT